MAVTNTPSPVPVYRKNENDKKIDNNYSASSNSDVLVSAGDQPYGTPIANINGGTHNSVVKVGNPTGAGTDVYRLRMAQILHANDNIGIIDDKSGKKRRSDYNTLGNN